MAEKSYYQDFLDCIKADLQKYGLNDSQIGDIIKLVDINARQHGVDWKLK